MPRREPTHEVTNQVPPIVGRDISTSAALFEGLEREGAGWAADEVRELALLGNSEHMQTAGRLANDHPPVLHTHDRYGNRVDEVEYLPQYHELMQVAVEHGLHGAPWADARPGAHAARAAKVHRVGRRRRRPPVPDLDDLRRRAGAAHDARRSPRPTSRCSPSAVYDSGLRAPLGKPGLIAGMSMTEKQGGSDVRANTTRAVPVGDGAYELTGHKWFTSAPMSDLFLTLAQAPGGLSCFLVPRVLPDGTPQRVLPAAAEGQARQQVQRLERGRVRRRARLAGR